MDEKRLSIRFRMDNDQDKKAWEILDSIAKEENTSKNSIALQLICKGADSWEQRDVHVLDVVAEKIAELVAGKISARYQKCAGMSIATKVPADGEKQEPQADELRTVSEEALSFLDEF